MIRQPVSRISFDRQRGFLGVHLQEGALFVDAAWNEAADISFALLRDAIRANGLEGTAGRELLIEPALEAGQLRNLWVRGTSAEPPRPFYANGLPVLWPADLLIDSQGSDDVFRELAGDDAARLAAPGSWVELLKPGVAYEIYVRARIATHDRLDDPFLDDPGLDAARGTFRKRVVADVRIREKRATCPPVRTNIELSVDGSYRSDLNLLYRVELDRLTGSDAFPAASVLWDLDAGATVARVVDTARAGARLVMVDTTERFGDGFVRFEGKGIGPELYTVMQAPGLEGAAIQVTPHRCDRAELSLAARQVVGGIENLGHDDDAFRATFVVPPATPSGSVKLVEPGDLVTALPAVLGASSGPWTVQAAERAVRSTATVDIVTFAPAGLAQALATLDEARGAVLRASVHQFDTTLTVDGPTSWKVGERVAIFAPPVTPPHGPAVTPTTVAAREDRVIVRIEPLTGPIPPTEHGPASAPATQRMLVRLDLPLSYDHAAGTLVIPERPIKARRFAGHACRVAITPVEVTRDRAASLQNFPAATALPNGLAIHLTTREGATPRLERGDGWHFAARGDGWVETRIYAPVEDESASEVVLAQLTLRAEGPELIDLRPRPAALAVDDELARIAAPASVLAGLLNGDPAAGLFAKVADQAGLARVQADLMRRLYELVMAKHARLSANQACRAWLERLGQAVAAVHVDAEPTCRQLAAIGFAIGGLAYAFSTLPSTLQGKKP